MAKGKFIQNLSAKLKEKGLALLTNLAGDLLINLGEMLKESANEELKNNNFEKDLKECSNDSK